MVRAISRRIVQWYYKPAHGEQVKGGLKCIVRFVVVSLHWNE